MSKFIFKVVAFLFSIISIIVFVSYFGDAGGIYYKKNIYVNIANNLLNNKFVYINSNIDERTLQKEIIFRSKKIPNSIVLGSSRVMQLGPLNNEYDFYNHSVSGCSIEDIAALLQMYKIKYNYFPNKIIIGLDPWIFNIHNEQKRYKSIEKYYKDFYSYNTHSSFFNNIDYYYQLFNPSYFNPSFKSLFSNNNTFTVSDSLQNGKMCRLPNGTIQYDSLNEFPKKSDLDILVKKMLQNSVYSLEKFTSIDKNKMNEFEVLIKKLSYSNCDLTFIIVPLHPDIFSFISKSKKYVNVIQSEIIFRKLAKKYNIKLYGSLNPFLYNYKESSFFDPFHLRKNETNLLLNYN